MFTIEEVKDEDQKMAVVDEVLKDLPEWFGIPESTQAYICLLYTSPSPRD